MVATRRSNGEAGDVDDGNYPVNDVGSVSDEKASNCSPRELRSGYKVKHKIQHWPKRYNRRLRTIKMPRIIFPESDTEPEKYSRRGRPMRVFFAEENDTPNISRKMCRRRGSRKNYMEDSEDKPIQQSIITDVRRSCRKRKLLHHNFNESWITNELKVKGYPDLYGFQGSSSSDEYFSGDEQTPKKMTNNHPPTNTDEDTQLSRQRRTSARFSNKKNIDASDSDSDNEKNETVIENKLKIEKEENNKDDQSNMEVEGEQQENKSEEDKPNEECESKRPARSTRARGTRRQKKDSQQETASDSSSSECRSELTLRRQPRRSGRQRQTKPAFVQITPRETKGRAAKTFTIRKKQYHLRKRNPKILRRKTIRTQSPSNSSSSSDSSSSDSDLNVSMKNKSKGRQKSKSMDNKDKALRDIQPVELDGKIRFSSVGGLEEHIKCLREMVLFPLMYPDLFKKFNTRPAKGVLFHGPPGTGKTLLARALANECSLIGGRKVSFFMRKGADCLKKWVGESERHLKLLFQQANKMKPSIIFFDEIDALAPVRSVKQEQVHTSVVGTLLAEMDGLCDRGEVVIIGATNRLDAVDPALRRAGRFDRELHFAPPHTDARRDILDIYTKHWVPKPNSDTLDYVASLTTGYGGSDLKALCSEAVLKALRRVYPQVYESEHALLIDTKNVEVSRDDMLEAIRSLVAAGARSNPLPAKKLSLDIKPLLKDQLQTLADTLQHILPDTHKSFTDPPLSQSVFLITGPCADTHLAPAMLSRLEGCAIKELNMAALHSPHAFTTDHAVITLFSECRRADTGAVLFIRELVSVWAIVGQLLPQLCRSRAAGDATLILATSSVPYPDLPQELQELFPMYKNCVYKMREPNVSEVISFLKPIITEVPLQLPIIESKDPPPELPIAPLPPPPKESVEEVSRRKRVEDYKLRELRIFLRDICRKLASNRRFHKFTKSVDLEEVTDYLEIVKQPMDLETMMTKVDMHKYNCAKEFLDDVDLICANALEYNPDRTSSDKQIRHEACSLRDHAHALIDVEMDSDFEMECQQIARRREEEGTQDNDVPDFIYTASNLTVGGVEDSKTPQSAQNGDKSETHSSKRKRRRYNAWSKGLVVKRQKTTPKTYKDPNMPITDEDSKENKPITSTPMHNGDATSSDASDDDAPLKRPRDDSATVFNGSANSVVSRIQESPTKSNDRSPTKSSPKKRNSGHDNSSGDLEKVLINKTELENILYKNSKTLRCIGLEALLDLHSQLSATVCSYSRQYDRTKLPHELSTVINRYLQLVKK